MYVPKRRNYRRKRPATAKRTYKKRTTAVSTAVKSYVARSIKKSSENKVVNWRYSGVLYNFNAPASQWFTYNFFQLTPNSVNLPITQGVTEQNRISNSIRTSKAMLKFVIIPNAYDFTVNPFPQPVNIRIVIGSSKQQPMIGPSFSDFNNYYFQNGSSSVGPNNNLLDMCSEINRDFFDIKYDKIVKLGYSQATGLGANNTYEFFSNNDYKYNVVRKMNITKYLPKNFLFNDNATNPTKGKSVYIWFMQVNANGVSIGGTSLQSQIYMDLDYHFEDGA